MLAVSGGLLLLAAGVWWVRRRQLPPTAKAVLQEHARSRRIARLESRRPILAAVGAGLGVFILFGWATDPAAWDTTGWMAMGIIGIATLACGRVFARWWFNRAGRAP